jgi:hypothetical protein
VLVFLQELEGKAEEPALPISLHTAKSRAESLERHPIGTDGY